MRVASSGAFCVCVRSCISVRVYLRRTTAGHTARQSFMLLWLLIRPRRPLARTSVRTQTHKTNTNVHIVCKYKRWHELTKRVFVNKMSVYGWKSFMRAMPIHVCTCTNTYLIYFLYIIYICMCIYTLNSVYKVCQAVCTLSRKRWRI